MPNKPETEHDPLAFLKIPIINLDVDNVLSAFVQQVLNFAGTAIREDEITAYDVLSELSRDERRAARYALNTEPFWRGMGTTLCGRRFIGWIREILPEVRINYVTSPWSLPGWYDWRYAWLKSTFHAQLTEYYPVYDKSNVYGHVFLDDKPENVERWQARWQGFGKAYLVTTPQNKNSYFGAIERIDFDKMYRDWDDGHEMVDLRRLCATAQEFADRMYKLRKENTPEKEFFAPLPPELCETTEPIKPKSKKKSPSDLRRSIKRKSKQWKPAPLPTL